MATPRLVPSHTSETDCCSIQTKALTRNKTSSAWPFWRTADYLHVKKQARWSRLKAQPYHSLVCDFGRTCPALSMSHLSMKSPVAPPHRAIVSGTVKHLPMAFKIQRLTTQPNFGILQILSSQGPGTVRHLEKQHPFLVSLHSWSYSRPPWTGAFHSAEERLWLGGLRDFSMVVSLGFYFSYDWLQMTSIWYPAMILPTKKQ